EPPSVRGRRSAQRGLVHGHEILSADPVEVGGPGRNLGGEGRAGGLAARRRVTALNGRELASNLEAHAAAETAPSDH
ncbi:MAG: hypothetical protein ACE5FJ_06895, partial [Gemmatimonadales bacterium]